MFLCDSTIMIIAMIIDIRYSALSTYSVQKRFIKNSQWTDVNGPYSQINSFQDRNVFSCILKFCTLSAALNHVETHLFAISLCDAESKILIIDVSGQKALLPAAKRRRRKAVRRKTGRCSLCVSN